MLFWSGNFIIGRYIHGDIEPVQLAFFRWLVVALLIFPMFITKFMKILKAIKTNFLVLNTLAILGITGFNTILYIGLSYTKATNALLINSFMPIVILLLSALILKIDIKPIQLFGIFFSTLGVLFLVLRGELDTLYSLELNHGDIWVLGAVFAWALYSVLIKFRPKGLSDFEFFMTIVYIGLFWLSFVYLSMGYSIIDDIALAQEFWWAFIYIALFSSVISYYFWHKGVEKIGANKASQFTHLMPLFGSILAFIFLGERFSLYHIIGAIFIGFGIYLSLFIKDKR